MIIEWIAMAFSMAGAISFAMDKPLRGLSLYLLGSIMWLIVAYYHGITAMMILNICYIVCETIGVYKMYNKKQYEDIQ